jgi:hypothetical protein
MPSVKSQVLTAVSTKITDSSDMTPCSLVDRYRCFRETCCLAHPPWMRRQNIPIYHTTQCHIPGDWNLDNSKYCVQTYMALSSHNYHCMNTKLDIIAVVTLTHNDLVTDLFSRSWGVSRWGGGGILLSWSYLKAPVSVTTLALSNRPNWMGPLHPLLWWTGSCFWNMTPKIPQIMDNVQHNIHIVN